MLNGSKAIYSAGDRTDSSITSEIAFTADYLAYTIIRIGRSTLKYNTRFSRGVAQLVARHVRDVEVRSSSLRTPTL